MRLSWLVLLTILLTAPAARGDDDVASAREHYQRGKRAYDTGHFDEAAHEYELAYRVKDDPALLYNLGQAHRLANHPSEALVAYKAYLRNVPNSPYRAEVEQRLAELKEIIAAKAQRDEQEKQRQQLQSQPQPQAAPAVASEPTAVLVATPPPPKALKRGWVWGVVAGGAVVIAGAVVLGVVLGSTTKAPSPSLGTAGARGF